MKTRNLFLLILLPVWLSAQNDTTGQHRLIKGIIDYRNELIARNPEGFKKLYLLDELWKEELKDDVDDLLLAATVVNKTKGVSAKDFVNMVLLLTPQDFKIRHLITEDIIQTIIDNDDLAMLLNESILKQKPPFLIDPENSIYQELGFYKVHNGMRVAEIGAGNGMFSLLLGISYDSLDIYINEINSDAINFSFDRINRCKSIRASNHFFATLGTPKSTALEEYKFDKVFIRNSFHHFSKKRKMLASIRQSLAPNGDLYVFDPVVQPGKSHCPKATTEEETREHLIKNGFTIEEELSVEPWGWKIWHCRPISTD